VKIVTALGVVALLGAGAAPDAPLADAAMRGDLAVVRALLERGADVNAAQGDGMSALHWAAQHGDRDMVQLLVRAGASLDAITRIGKYTPLHLASKIGEADVVAALLEAGSNVKAVTNSGAQAIHFAAASGSPATVEVLLDKGADANAIESEWGQTPLIFAAALDRADAIKALLQRGADPKLASKTLDLVKQGKIENAANQRQRQVLEAAGKDAVPTPAQVQGALAAARQIIVSGVIPEPPKEDSARGRQQGQGQGQQQQNNQDDETPPAIESMGGLTPLHHAARQGNLAAVRALVDGGADVNQLSGDKSTALLMAVINGQFDVAMLLVERKADPNLAAATNGVFPLWAAVNAQWQPRTRFPQPQEMLRQRATYVDVMKALLVAGADPNARTTMHPWYMVYSGCGNRNCGLADTKGSTAFWRAAYATDVVAMKLLVEHGADPSIPTLAPAPQRRGRDGATGRDVQETPTWAMDPSGLPPIAEGGPGIFAIHAASGVGYGEGFAGNAHRFAPDGWLPSVKYLIEEVGADVNARDNNGYTPLHHAAARGDDEMILYLVSMGADVNAVSRKDQTTADMANGPVSRVSPIPRTVALLERLGSKNNHRCLTC
jgi:ankyrin repeat protein